MADTNNEKSKFIVVNTGFEYEVDKFCDALDAGLEPKIALRSLYPTLPPKSIAPILAKIKKHPYYIARKDLELNIVKAAAPELQMNLVNIALNGRSERNRLDATTDALDRIYGNATEEQAQMPQFHFNFSFGANTAENRPKVSLDDGTIIDV